MHIRELGLPTPTYNVLVSDNVLSVEELIAKTPSELMRTPYFGRIKLGHVVAALETKGLKLASYDDDNWMDDLGLGGRAKSVIARSGCPSLGDLLKLSRKQILQMHMGGPTVADEIEEALAQRGLSLYGNQIELQEEIDRLEKRALEHERKAAGLRERVETIRGDQARDKLSETLKSRHTGETGRQFDGFLT